MSELVILSSRESLAFIHQEVQLIDIRSVKSYVGGHIEGSLSLPGGRFHWAASLSPEAITNRRALLLAETPLVAQAAAEDLSQSHFAIVGAWIVSREGLMKAGLRVRITPQVLLARVPQYLSAHPDTIAFDIRETHEAEKFPWSVGAHLSPLSTWPRTLPSVDPTEPVLVMGSDPYRSLWAAWVLIHWGYKNVAYSSITL